MWVEFEPDSVTARQTLAALLVSVDRLDEARPHLEKLLASEGDNVDEAFMQLNGLLARSPNKIAAFELVKQLAEPYPESAGSPFCRIPGGMVCQPVRYRVGRDETGAGARPDWEIAAIYQGRILARNSNASAHANFSKSYLKNLSESQRYANNLCPVVAWRRKITPRRADSSSNCWRRIPEMPT